MTSATTTRSTPVFVSTFSKKRGQKIGYVHFLPETMEGSLKIPQPFRGLFYRYLIAFYKRMDHLVVVNPTFIPKLVAYGIPQERVTYIPNFVDDQRFYPVSAAKRWELYRRWKLDPERFTVVGSGQIQERKGVFDFIKLAKQNPHFQFIWAGAFPLAGSPMATKSSRRLSLTRRPTSCSRGSLPATRLPS